MKNNRLKSISGKLLLAGLLIFASLGKVTLEAYHYKINNGTQEPFKQLSIYAKLGGDTTVDNLNPGSSVDWDTGIHCVDGVGIYSDRLGRVFGRPGCGEGNPSLACSIPQTGANLACRDFEGSIVYDEYGNLIFSEGVSPDDAQNGAGYHYTFYNKTSEPIFIVLDKQECTSQNSGRIEPGKMVTFHTGGCCAWRLTIKAANREYNEVVYTDNVKRNNSIMPTTGRFVNNLLCRSYAGTISNADNGKFKLEEGKHL